MLKSKLSDLIYLLPKYKVNPIDYFNVNVMQGCNSKCETCHLWKSNKTALSYKAFKNALQKVSKYIDTSKQIKMHFAAAGEPLLNKEIYEMLNLSNKLGYKTVLITNALLISSKNAEKLITSGLYHINLSLDSHDLIKNDNMRGINGYHKRVMNAILYLDDYKKRYNSNCTIGIHTTIFKKNINDIPDFVKWVHQNKKLENIRFQAVTQVFGTKEVKNWYTLPEYSFLWPKKSTSMKIYDILIDMKKKGFKIDNSIENLINQKEYFLNPQKITNIKSIKCETYKVIMMHANGKVDMCPVASKEIFNANDCTINSNALKISLIKEQKRIKKCNDINCHFVINCKMN